MEIGFVFCSSPESSMFCDDVLLSGPPLYQSVSHLEIYLHSAWARWRWQAKWCCKIYVCVHTSGEQNQADGKHPIGEPIIIFSSCPSHLLPFSNHWKEKTARIVPSIASPATEACTLPPPATAHRCCPSSRPPRPRLQIRPTILGRKNQILLKSGPSPGACMKIDVSSTLAPVLPGPHLGAPTLSWGLLRIDCQCVNRREMNPGERWQHLRAVIESARYSLRLCSVISLGGVG